MITWGLVSGCMAFVQGTTSFYILRFLLGVAEAGFFPALSFISATGSGSQTRAGYRHLYGRCTAFHRAGIAYFSRSPRNARFPRLRRMAVDVCAGSPAGTGAWGCGSVLPYRSSGQGQMAD